MFGDNNEPQINFDSIQTVSDSKRRLRLLFALALLITALILVVMKNRQFWLDALTFGDTSGETVSDTIKKIGPPVNPARSRKTVAKQSALSNAETQTAVVAQPHEAIPDTLQVDVTYASGQHETIVARNSAVHFDLQQSAPPSATKSDYATGTETHTGSSGAQVRFSGGTVEIVGRPTEPVYPLPAQKANVQGSVVLQAKIGEDGSVQGLQVISGPPMLTTAAMVAVKQWQFKPHYEAGKAVPTETRITVSFTISTQ